MHAAHRNRRGPTRVDSLRVIGAMVLAFSLFVGFMIVSDLRHAARPESRLHSAVKTNDIEALRALLAEGVDVNHRYPRTYDTVLHHAAWAGKSQVVRLLLERGADPNIADAWSAETPLHSAVRGNQADIVRMLLDAGARTSMRLNRDSEQCISGLVYPYGSTPVDIARIGGYSEVQRLLEQADRRR